MVKSIEMTGRVGAKHCRGEYRRGEDDKIVPGPVAIHSCGMCTTFGGP
jgi:hypothetical protein